MRALTIHRRMCLMLRAASTSTEPRYAWSSLWSLNACVHVCTQSVATPMAWTASRSVACVHIADRLHTASDACHATVHPHTRPGNPIPPVRVATWVFSGMYRPYVRPHTSACGWLRVGGYRCDAYVIVLASLLSFGYVIYVFCQRYQKSCRSPAGSDAMVIVSGFCHIFIAVIWGVI